MSASPGIGHNSTVRTDDLQRRYEANVIAISNWVGKRRIEEALSRQQLGSLTGLDRIITLRNTTLDGLHQLYLTNPGADVAPGLFALICIMSDNSQGCCSMSVSRMAQFLNRDRSNVGKALKRLERDGCIKTDRQRSRDDDGNERAAGKAPLAWPVINPIYAEHRDPITWVLDAHAPTARHIKRAIQPSQVGEPAVQTPHVVEPAAQASHVTLETCGAAIDDLRYRRREPAVQTPHNTTKDTANDNASRRRASCNSEVDELVEAYNVRADLHGWAKCESLGPDRARRLLRRVREIGGQERFRSAMDVIPRDDFLSGRIPGRNGQAPFRLSLDRLLQTNGGLGDVLARLLEEHAPKAAEPEPVNGRHWGWWRDDESRLRSLPLETWEKAIAEACPGAAWPWWALTAPPGDPECFVPACLVHQHGFDRLYDRSGKRKEGARP